MFRRRVHLRVLHAGAVHHRPAVREVLRPAHHLVGRAVAQAVHLRVQVDHHLAHRLLQEAPAVRAVLLAVRAVLRRLLHGALPRLPVQVLVLVAVRQVQVGQVPQVLLHLFLVHPVLHHHLRADQAVVRPVHLLGVPHLLRVQVHRAHREVHHPAPAVRLDQVPAHLLLHRAAGRVLQVHRRRVQVEVPAVHQAVVLRVQVRQVPARFLGRFVKNHLEPGLIGWLSNGLDNSI